MPRSGNLGAQICGMEKIISHIRPIDWTMGDVYGMDFRLSGINPHVQINWGDGGSETFHGNEISARRTRKLVIDNPDLELLNLTISLGENYELSKCPKLRDFGFSAENRKIHSLDLSHCHQLEISNDTTQSGIRSFEKAYRSWRTEADTQLKT